MRPTLEHLCEAHGLIETHVTSPCYAIDRASYFSTQTLWKGRTIMALLDILSLNQTQTDAHPSSLEELHPIRRGIEARQPAARASDVLYVGLAQMLPKGIQALCSCAGLFFAQFVERCADGDLSRFRVAAQPRYLHGDDRTVRQHVRELFFTREQAASIFDYDRRLSGLPTCDVRALVEQHTAKVRLQQRVLAGEEPSIETLASKTVVPTESVEPAPRKEEAEPLAPNAREANTMDEDVVEAEPEVVIVPLHVLRASVAASPDLHQRIDEMTQEPYPLFRPSGRSMPRHLLRSTLWWMECEMREIRQSLKLELPKEGKEEQVARLRELSRQTNHLHHALHHHDVAALVSILPVYGRGRSGRLESCRIEIDIPRKRTRPRAA